MLSEKMILVLKDIERLKKENQEKKLNKGVVEIKKTKNIHITKEEFNSFESCRKSGLTNMFNLSNVELITGLSKDKIKAINQEYEHLFKLYIGVENVA